jgi:hypothetical protein
MPNINAASARMWFFASSAAMILVAGNASDAAATRRVHAAHFHSLNARAQYIQSVPVQENTGPTVMRYYGGPKSAMWREDR